MLVLNVSSIAKEAPTEPIKDVPGQFRYSLAVPCVNQRKIHARLHQVVHTDPPCVPPADRICFDKHIVNELLVGVEALPFQLLALSELVIDKNFRTEGGIGREAQRY